MNRLRHKEVKIKSGRPRCPHRMRAAEKGAPKYTDAKGVERWVSSGNRTDTKREWERNKRRAAGVLPQLKAAPEVIAAKNRANVKRWRKENPQGKASQQRTYRTRRFGTHGRHDRHDVSRLLNNQDEQCFYCAGPMEPITWDHFIPSARGGDNDLDNGRLACHACNTAKNDMLPRDFFIKVWNVL